MVSHRMLIYFLYNLLVLNDLYNRHLKGFECRIQLRSEQHLLLVERHNSSMR